jgi:hypothetical protein
MSNIRMITQGKMIIENESLMMKIEEFGDLMHKAKIYIEKMLEN